MRVLHVVPTYLPAVRYGGPIFAVHGLCRALTARGHEVEVFTTNVDGPNNSAVPLGRPVRLDGVQVNYFESKLLRRIYWSPQMARALAARVPTFDVVHLHSVFLWPTWAAGACARRAGAPYVISPRGMLVKGLIKRRSRIVKSAWLQLIERRNLEGASAIHVTSEVEAREVSRFGWSLRNVSIIPNGLDDEPPESAAAISADVRELVAHQPLILYFGRLSWKKGLDRLIASFASSPIGSLAIAGPDEDNLVSPLTELARELKVLDRVHFLPRVVLGADKEHLYRSARIFVLTSYSENFGNTVLEAMQRGIPVIVTPEVGAAEIVARAKAGVVVDGIPALLGDAIRQLAENEGLARGMGKAGAEYVRSFYGWARIGAKVESLYQSL